MDIASNFSEQFSNSPSNNGDLTRIQNNNEAANSLWEGETTPNFCKERDIDAIGNSNGSSSDLASPNSKNNSRPKHSSSSIRNEKGIQNEDDSLSPQIVSPMGLTSGGQQSLRDNDKNEVNRSMNLSPSSSDKSGTFPLSGCNEMEERSTNISLANEVSVTSNINSGCSDNSKCRSDSDLVSYTSTISRNLPSTDKNLAKYNSSISGGDSGLALNSSRGNGGDDYMQQQNHVFVFSTQLANKSAEAVICGQFPTIIAYHCMQPTTKLFLEDFLKNPTKTTKLQRQYSLNIMNVKQSGPGPDDGHPSYWLKECNNLDRLPPQRLPLRNVGVCAGGKKNVNWDPASVHENQTCTAPTTLDTLSNVDAGGKADDKSNIPSLQGVKVPDENLTPQQRQHREEQLAKLKKMNKFLFPENDGNNFQVPPHTSSSSASDTAGNTIDMHNSVGLSLESAANKICPPTMRNTSNNLAKTGVQNLDARSDMGVNDSILPPDIVLSANNTQNVGPLQNLKFGTYMSKMNSSAVSNFNTLKSRQCDMGNGQSVVGMDNSPDITSVSNFIMNNCSTSEAESLGSRSSDMAMSQTEWTKLQNSTFQDDFNGERQQNVVNQTGLSAEPLGCQQNSPLSRSLSTAISGYGSTQCRPNKEPSSTNSNNNGPPPPYHQTPRSASVPIAAESPTSASPNKPSTDTPLSSPKASSRVQFGVPSTQPNTEMSNPTISTCPTFNGSTSSNVNSTAQVNSHNNSTLNNIATNSPASLSYVSPKELDCIDLGGQKSKMASPHKFKSGCGMMNDLPDMDTKYNHFGMGYPMCNIPPQTVRHNMQQIPTQFRRRTDNIPLNPNCNRVNQSKNATTFDPISSLTQMSQQLTGVGLGAVGSNGNASGGLGVMDMNPGELNASRSTMRSTCDPSLDHCNKLSNNIGMAGGLVGALGRVTGQFAPEMNNMLCSDTGPMDQRMLNGKMCVPNMAGSFGSNSALTGVGLRESVIGCNDISSSNRMISRRGMPGNFENFNMSPNVHVKVSAPNTIQYMPVRSQNINNMRVPPSVEFFQRYSNSQIMGSMGGGVGHPSGGLMTNTISNLNVMNMFGNCNQMSTGGGPLNGNVNRGFEQNDLVEGNVLSHNDYMNVAE